MVLVFGPCGVQWLWWMKCVVVKVVYTIVTWVCTGCCLSVPVVVLDGGVVVVVVVAVIVVFSNNRRVKVVVIVAIVVITVVK